MQLNPSLHNPIILEYIENWVKKKLPPDPTGHDWHHAERVRRMAVTIHQHEGGNRLIIECAALLHDVYDWKFNSDDETKHLGQIQSMLHQWNMDQADIISVVEIIRNTSFKGAGTEQVELSLEGKIVQDADRLEALGAIGIARALAYGGFRGRLIYNPDVPPQMHQSFEEYKTRQSTTINHFYEKLLLLKDRMNTPTGRRFAEQRHQFMETFLKHFFNEWTSKIE